MNPNTLVSVIIPVKNGERYLGTAIESVKKQTYTNYELIIVDDQSTDQSASIAKSYPNIKYILGIGKGSAAAYNTGIDAAKGELITFLDYDDFWTENKLMIQVNYLNEYPEVQYVIAKMKSFLEPGCSIPLGFRQELLDQDAIAPIPGTLVARKTLFDTIGKFNPNLNTAEDVDWFARCQDAKIKMSIINEVLLYKRVHGSNLSLNTTNNNQNLLKVLRSSIQRKRQEHR